MKSQPLAELRVDGGAAANDLLQRHLLPLLETDPASLSAGLQDIRQQLLQLLAEGRLQTKASSTDDPATKSTP